MMAEAKAQYSAILLGATGNVGGTHRAASDQKPAVQEGGGGDAPQDGRLRLGTEGALPEASGSPLTWWRKGVLQEWHAA